jgi:hypothetical protein
MLCFPRLAEPLPKPYANTLDDADDAPIDCRIF